MRNLTVVIIAKNEQNLLPDCLQSVKFADKVIVVDCNSTDKTAQIAKAAGAKVITHTFENFAKLRNYPLSQIDTEWVLYVDADERPSQLLRRSIINALPGKTDAYFLVRKNFYFGKPWPHHEKIARLFRKNALLGWFGDIHESAKYQGQAQVLAGDLLHYTHNNLDEMIAKTIIWSDMEAKLKLETIHPPVTWWRLIRVFITGFTNSYINQQGFKLGAIGLIESLYQGYSMFFTYVRLWELQNQK